MFCHRFIYEYMDTDYRTRQDVNEYDRHGHVQVYEKLSSFCFYRQSNLAKGDITRLIMTYPTQHTATLSISSILFARWQHASRSGSWDAFGIPILGKGRHRESAMVPFERVTVVSYRFSVVTIVRSLTIRLRFTIDRLRL